MLFRTVYASFLVAHQLLFCAIKVPEKYVTGLISVLLLCHWHKTLEFPLFEALLGYGDCNMGLLKKISFKQFNMSWHSLNHMKGVFFFNK